MSQGAVQVKLFSTGLVNREESISFLFLLVLGQVLLVQPFDSLDLEEDDVGEASQDVYYYADDLESEEVGSHFLPVACLVLVHQRTLRALLRVPADQSDQHCDESEGDVERE
eukprot:CAMPEP_0168619608 /NCGR_PEP_ID=MMETSP0449_2-20121227/6692_1 /TAXON_ID=1082188 /ORGANISM="Strombidium rassoulzadegani, Strain ras09" /LENGTH=111 /DNA_ID=CAMNT_0008660553 /DNA_START=318 /DNA_END=653 /DNA_ORIENTATION=-